MSDLAADIGRDRRAVVQDLQDATWLATVWGPSAVGVDAFGRSCRAAAAGARSTAAGARRRLNRSFNQDSFIEYDGTRPIGGKTCTYADVVQGECYLLAPKSENFRELENQDLEVNSSDADVSP